LGRGGESLARKTLEMKAQSFFPQDRRQLLDLAVAGARGRNGVAQIKCDLPQVLPFLLDPDCFRVLGQARYVYLTRRDVLGQAISRYRGFRAGVWHSRSVGAEGPHDTPVAHPETETPYDFEAIAKQVGQITQMMAGWEQVFAMLNIQPLRISYEELTRDPVSVTAAIAGLMEVTLPADLTLEAGGYTKVGGRSNDDMRERFLAEVKGLVG
jgi:LPS sulfotransferase NodH